LLYYGQDQRLIDIVGPFFDIRKKDFGEINSITHIHEDKKLDEALTAITFDILILEQQMMAPTPTDWLTSLKRKWPALKGQILLAGDETDPVKMMKYIEGGFKDYIVFPPDKPLLIEKIALYTTGTRSSDARQVYSLQMNQQTDLAKPGFIEELSEFDCKVRSFQKPEIDEMMVLYSKAFSENMDSKTSVLARCYETAEHEGFKGQFLSKYYFLGVTPEILTNIRNALRKTYIHKKQK
jgi:hypothetical protein